MRKLKQAGRFTKAHRPAKDPEEMARRVSKEGQDPESLPPHFAIRHPDLRAFWGKCIVKDEVAWDTFWLHFPTGLGLDAGGIECSFSSQNERSAFQTALQVVGTPEHVNVSMIDAAFPPGCPLGITTAKLLGNAESEKRLEKTSKERSKHLSMVQQSCGFWDEAPPPLPSLIALVGGVEAELTSPDRQSSVAQIMGHIGSGAASVAATAAKGLLKNEHWTSAVYVNMKGACSTEVAAARLATALHILSYPVIADELLRLTAYFHTIAGKPGKLGIVLDAEGCIRADELHALAVLLTTIVKAGGSSLQVIVAGEGILQLPPSLQCSAFQVVMPDREEETKFLEGVVRADFLGTSASAVAAACCHQISLLQLTAANLRSGYTPPQMLLDAMCARVPQCAANLGGKARSFPVETVIAAVMSTLSPAQQDALYRLSVLPQTFTIQAAAKVLGQKEGEDIDAVLLPLVDKAFLRKNAAICTYGMFPSIRAVIRVQARQNAPSTYESAVQALLEYSLAVAGTAGALNLANAQVAAMRTIDREREIFDEVATRLRDRTPLPAASTALYADLVSQHMELLGFRLSFRQQQELCVACAQASRREGDMLAEAHCLQHLGPLNNIQAADAAMARAMTTLEKALTPSHPVIADMLLSWARLHAQAGNNHQAERLLRKSLEIQLLHPEGKEMAVAATQTRLAGVLIGMKSSESARPYLQTAMEATFRQLGRHHPDTALAQCRLASCLADLREYEDAHTLYLMALDGWRTSLGHCHPQFATLLGQLAYCCRRLGRPEEAEQYHRRSIQMWKEMMVLDQPELQDDLKALLELLQSQGRVQEAAAIRDQLHKLVEAVKAACQRVSAKPPSLRRSLKKALLKPLKALFGYSRKAPPAFVALPAGIQDSDLEEIRNAAKAHEPRKRSAESPVSTARQSATDTSARGSIADTTGGTATQRSESTVYGSTRSAEADTPMAGNGMENTVHAPPTSPNEESLPAIAIEKQLLEEHDDTNSPGTAKSGKRNQSDKASKAGKEVYVPQPTAPFGSKGHGPAPVEGGGIWAASLRNPSIPLGSTAKRTSEGSVGPRNNSSATKNRLFTSNERRTSRSGKDSTNGGNKDGSTDDLIRAHLADDNIDWADGAEGKHWRRSSSGYATDETITDGPALGSQPPSARDHLITSVNSADPTASVGKNVIGFFNPMFTQQGISRSSSRTASMTGEKAEV